MNHNGFRGSARPCRLDVHQKRGNSLCRFNAHCKKNNFVHRSHSRFAGLIINASRLKLSFFSLFVSVVLNWLITHLFDSFGRRNRLRELNTRLDPRR